MMDLSRRKFLQTGALAGTGFLLPVRHWKNDGWRGAPELLSLSEDLLGRWGVGLLALQVDRPADKSLHGGFLCPACSTIHGRCGDAIFPLLYLAEKNKDERYLKAAVDVYGWMEETVSMPDGSWVNEVSVSLWKGTTVFATIALAESILHFSHLVDVSMQARWKDRLYKAGQYLYDTFTIQTGNINYPIACSYALSLAGTVLDNRSFKERGVSLAHEALRCITPRGRLIFGEGHPQKEVSPKGCYAVDLGYNVEESLPSLVLYGRLTNDKEVLEAAVVTLRAHMEFMLPDGGWDNSWGTRNYKWTYWGSRTSDGCQPAYAFMAAYDPVFYKVALQNTRLLDQNTHDNLLYGGPHYRQHGVLPCVHHTFSHSKALTTLLVRRDWNSPPSEAAVWLPREKEYGIKAFPEIDTWLISKKGWRATVTGYDQEYTMKSGHASGGALTLLWHERVGLLIAAGMNKYQLVEPFNMQRERDLLTGCLTPRWEREVDGVIYSNINDLGAVIEMTKEGDDDIIVVHARMVDENQQPAPGASPEVRIAYRFSDEGLTINARSAGGKYLLPLVATSSEALEALSEKKWRLHKRGGVVTVDASLSGATAIDGKDRIFNFVPGVEAIPLTWMGDEVGIKIALSL